MATKGKAIAMDAIVNAVALETALHELAVLEMEITLEKVTWETAQQETAAVQSGRVWGEDMDVQGGKMGDRGFKRCCGPQSSRWGLSLLVPSLVDRGVQGYLPSPSTKIH